MNDPVDQPAHAVTSAEPVPVVQVAKASPRERTINDLAELLNTLLRFHATVVPVRRGSESVDVHGGPQTRVRRERREKPPEEWIVQIFNGGSLLVPEGWEPADFSHGMTSAIQGVCEPRQREVASAAIALLTANELSPEKALATGKRVAALIESGTQFSRFGTKPYKNEQFGYMLCARQAEVRYRNATHAQAFAQELNSVIGGVAAPQIDQIKAAMVEQLRAKES